MTTFQEATLVAAVLLTLGNQATCNAQDTEMPWVEVADDQRGFVLVPSGKPFSAWGFNYDHDETGRLIEDYWDGEWKKVEDDFAEMRAMGANVVRTLAGFAIGKPVVIEETFLLKCSPQELEEFIDGSKMHASGWIGFYWGQTPEELRKSKGIGDALMLQWLELFQRKVP